MERGAVGACWCPALGILELVFKAFLFPLAQLFSAQC